MTYQQRQKLNELSKLVFGSSSRWQKIVNKGVAEPMERDREVTLPDNKGGLKTKVYTDKKSVVRHYTVEEVTQLMEDLLKTKN
jgi:hypothetical protein